MFALEFVRLDGVCHIPRIHHLQPDVAPQAELDALLTTMRQEVQAPVLQMSPGRWAMQVASQVWAVRIVRVGDPGDTQRDMAAAELDTMELSR